jgi:lipopolysaccharide transport system ATP-binding protein
MLAEVLPPQGTSGERRYSITATNDDIAISARNLGKMYHLYDRPQDRLKQAFLWGRKQLYREFWALRDVSFEVRRGEALGIIGRNGAGKSTLLQILAGTLLPTAGEVQIKGRVAALLELGSGFNPEFTGRENVYLNGAILGFSREEMDERFDEIAAFADIGDFIDQPVKFYSSGMFVRLAFAVQACLEPKVLIVDEVLSVGDIFFQQKCHARMEELLTSHTAVIIVSHDMTAIEKYSTQAMLLDKGRCLFLGRPNEAISRYYQIERPFKPNAISAESVYNLELGADTAPFESIAIPDWPAEDAFLDLSQAIVIGEEEVVTCTGVALCNDRGEPCTTFQIGDVACFYYEFQLLRDIAVPVGGVTITNNMNINIHGKNSLQYLLKAPPVIRKGTRVRFRQRMELAVMPGEYTFEVGFASISAHDYAHVTEMDYAQLYQKLQGILRVRQAGIILVQGRAQGLNIPFYGYADLKGDCVLSVLERYGWEKGGIPLTRDW